MKILRAPSQQVFQFGTGPLELEKGVFQVALGDRLLKSGHLLQELQDYLDEYRVEKTELEEKNTDYLKQLLKRNPTNQQIQQVATRYKEAQNKLSEKLEHHLENFQRQNKDVLKFFSMLPSDATIYLPASQMYLAPEIPRFRALLRSLGMIQEGRIAYTGRKEQLVRQAEAYLEGKQHVHTPEMKERVEKVIQEEQARLAGRKEELNKQLIKLETATNYVRKLEKRQKELTEYELTMKEKLTNEIHTQTPIVEKLYDEVYQSEERLNYLQNLHQFGYTRQVSLTEKGEQKATEIIDDARGYLGEKLGPGTAGVAFMSGQYRGLTPDEVPIDYLIWISSGGEIEEKAKEYRTATGSKLLIPLNFRRYRAEFADSNMKRFVRDYFRTSAGKRRLEEYYRDATDEYVKVLLGAVPELESLSRRIQTNKERANRKPGEATREAIENYQRLLESKSLFMRRARYRSVYRETYQAKLQEMLRNVPAPGEEKNPRPRGFMAKYVKMLEDLIAKGPETTGVRRAKGIARAAAEKAYQAALRDHNLDDYSVLYRRFLKAGLTPEQAQEEAQRAVKETTRNWRTPAAYSGQGMSREEKKALTKQEKDAETILLHQLANTPGVRLSPATRAAIDPNWKPKSPRWYAMKTRGSWRALNRIEKSLEQMADPTRVISQEIASAQLEQLDEIEQKVLRLFVNVEETTGQLRQDIHPAVEHLSQQIAEKRARLEVLQRNLHASGQTTPAPEVEVPADYDEEGNHASPWAMVDELINEEGVYHEAQRSALEQDYEEDRTAIDETLDAEIAQRQQEMEMEKNSIVRKYYFHQTMPAGESWWGVYERAGDPVEDDPVSYQGEGRLLGVPSRKILKGRGGLSQEAAEDLARSQNPEGQQTFGFEDEAPLPHEVSGVDKPDLSDVHPMDLIDPENRNWRRKPPI